MKWDRIFAVVLVSLCLIAAVGNWFIGGPSGSPSASSSGAKSDAPDIALIRISGGIAEGGDGGGPFQSGGAGSTRLIKAIRQAREDDVKAIFLQINSPGGTASASNAIYQELMRTRNETDIKIVALLGDVAASGGYYVASAANHIVANPDTTTGSIGVIIRTQNLSPLLEKVGVENSNYKSGQFKDILSPYRESTEAEKKLLQVLVDEAYQSFLEAIAAGRDLSIEDITPYADGRILSGNQALQAKLVDSLGNYYDAVETIRDLAKIKAKKPDIRSYPSSGFPGVFSNWFSLSLENYFPGLHETQLALRWNKIPLTLME